MGGEVVLTYDAPPPTARMRLLSKSHDRSSTGPPKASTCSPTPTPTNASHTTHKKRRSVPRGRLCNPRLTSPPTPPHTTQPASQQRQRRRADAQVPHLNFQHVVGAVPGPHPHLARVVCSGAGGGGTHVRGKKTAEPAPRAPPPRTRLHVCAGHTSHLQPRRQPCAKYWVRCAAPPRRPAPPLGT